MLNIILAVIGALAYGFIEYLQAKIWDSKEISGEYKYRLVFIHGCFKIAVLLGVVYCLVKYIIE